MRESMRLLLSVFNEKQRRLYLGLESMRVGHGGDVKISRITGVNVKTIALGRQQLLERNVTLERIREVGGGRPSIKKKDVLALLDELMKADTAGDPMSDTRWSRKGTRSLSREMNAQGVRLCPKSPLRPVVEKLCKSFLFISCKLSDSMYTRRVNPQPSAVPRNGRRSLVHKMNQAHVTARSSSPYAF